MYCGNTTDYVINRDDGCDDVEPDDEVCHMADLNPMWLMFMRSIKHYSAWIMAVQDGLLQGGDYARDNATNVIHQFSSHVDESSVSQVSINNFERNFN